MKARTYPHSLIAEECSKKFTNGYDMLECVINSTQIYYGKIDKKECGDRWVEVPPI